MTTATIPVLNLAVEDVMSINLITLPKQMSLQSAAHLLRRANVTGAPVVDESGCCVGVLSAVDFLRWVDEGCPESEESPNAPSCSYQKPGRLLTGQKAVICTQSWGRCPLQVLQPTTAGRHTAVCQAPNAIFSDWQQTVEQLPTGTVGDYMTTDVVMAEMGTTLVEVSRMMVDAHIHRIVVLNELHRPVGIVTSTDILAALARMN